MDAGIAEKIVASTPMLWDVDDVEPLKKGYSDDAKFILWRRGTPAYLLRLSDAGTQERRLREFNLMGLHYSRGTPCPEPYLFDITEDGARCYSVVSYVQGRTAREALPELGTGLQYDLGFTVGVELHKMHEVPCPDPAFDWAAHREIKYRRMVQAARDLSVGFAYQREVEVYIESALGLLKRSPIRFQHDDYHPGNLIINEGTFAGVIDFNRCDWGDPFEDFIRMPFFTAPVSLPFARGQIDGYLRDFENVESFWTRYNLFVAMTLHASIVWTKRLFPETMDAWQLLVKEIVETHDFRNGRPPVWYKEDINLIDVNKDESQ